MDEKISVIVPIYNVEPYLKRCVDSLLEQTYQNFEILLVDDCSTDNGPEIAKEYAQTHPQLCRFIQREKNGGLSAARNTAMEAAQGEWLAFVDSDDWVTEDYLSSMYEVAQRDQADIVMSSRYYYYPDTGKVVEVSPFSNLETNSSQNEKIALCMPSATARLFRTSLFRESGLVFPTNVWRAAEQGIIIPLLTRTSKISILNKPMYYYLQRSDSNSNKNHKNVDISFYPKSVENVENNSMSLFETELEFRAISDLMYGMIMIMMRSDRSREEVNKQVDWFDEKYPEWRKNPYLVKLPKGKRIFISCAGRKQYTVLKVLIWLWDRKQKISKG